MLFLKSQNNAAPLHTIPGAARAMGGRRKVGWASRFPGAHITFPATQHMPPSFQSSLPFFSSLPWDATWGRIFPIQLGQTPQVNPPAPSIHSTTGGTTLVGGRAGLDSFLKHYLDPTHGCNISSFFAPALR